VKHNLSLDLVDRLTGRLISSSSTTKAMPGPLSQTGVRPATSVGSAPKAQPWLSIIIPVYNSWSTLLNCLESLMLQRGVPPFEILVVDDGSVEPPAVIRNRIVQFKIKMLRQNHSGVSVARNHGIELASGEILMFIDSDCTARQGCLASVMKTVPTHPGDQAFQLHVVGDRSYPVGRAEELHLETVQRHKLDATGRILWLNTAGFVLRNQKSWVSNLFDARALRGQDTELLARLLASGKHPIFLPDAVVEHHPDLTVWKYLVKALRSGYRAARTMEIMETYKVKWDSTARERFEMFQSMWTMSRQSSLGHQAFFVTAATRLLIKIGHVAYKIK